MCYFIHVEKAIVIQGAGMKGRRFAHRILSLALLVLCLFAAWQAEAPQAVGAEDPVGKHEGADMIGKFDFETKTVLLNSGYKMPILGLGTYALDYDTCVNSVKTLLQNGGRLIDTAYMYGNEDAVGEGVRQAMAEYGIDREEIFVITKIYPNQFHDPEAAIDMALNKLDIGYIDMMLLHHPQVSITPALVQNEIHPYYQEKDVVPFIQEQGVVVQCWYPLGGRGYTAALLHDNTICAIANAHGVSAAQVILRWDLQRGVVVIPGSGNPEHIKENLDLFGFELSEAEMDAIAALDRVEKHDWY